MASRNTEHFGASGYILYICVVRRALNLLRASYSPIFQYFSAINGKIIEVVRLSINGKIIEVVRLSINEKIIEVVRLGGLAPARPIIKYIGIK